MAKIYGMMLNNWQIKAKAIVGARNVSKERVCHIFHENLGIRKYVSVLYI
jgi:hypothetical protein